jgi:hypothetical protein
MIIRRHVVRRIGIHLGCLGLMLTVSGCGGGIKCFPVSGRVTLDGKPLADAVVSFMPEDEGGVAPSGVTDKSGIYTLRQTAEADGAPAGHYTVRITTYREGKPWADPPVPGAAERVPGEYNLRTTLREEVKAEENSIDFRLTSSGEIVHPAGDE